MSKAKQRLVEELHAPARKNFPRRRVVLKGIDDLWQADIVDMRAYARSNAGHQYILTVIDTFSKYGWAAALKTKSGDEVARTFRKIIDEGGRSPKNLQTDDGKEFFNTRFKKLMNERSINHYSTYSPLKASIVERWNRTMKSKMWKMFTMNGNYKWVKSLPTLVDEYNRRVHRTIGMRPIDVSSKQERKLLTTVYSNIKIAGPAKFKVGDYVRVSKYKNLFEKGYTPNWTTEVFRVLRIQRTNPVTYLLSDSAGKEVLGGFYQHELQRVTDPDVYLVERVLRRKGDKVFVKWLGMDSMYNSWINKENVL